MTATRVDEIRVEALHVSCLVGILPEERRREQPLIVDIVLGVDSRSAGRSGRISDTVDYDRVSREVETLLRFREYRLLEMAAEEVCAMLLGVHPELRYVRLRLSKPRALQGRAASASIEIERRPGDFERGHEVNDFGEVDILFESAEAGLYLLHVEPGRGIAPHFHRQMRELEWLVCGELERDGRRLEGLSPITWEHERVHRYDNRGQSRATLFCCDSPPFIRADEILAGLEDTQSEASHGS